MPRHVVSEAFTRNESQDGTEDASSIEGGAGVERGKPAANSEGRDDVVDEPRIEATVIITSRRRLLDAIQ